MATTVTRTTRNTKTTCIGAMTTTTTTTATTTTIITTIMTRTTTFITMITITIVTRCVRTYDVRNIIIRNKSPMPMPTNVINNNMETTTLHRNTYVHVEGVMQIMSSGRLVVNDRLAACNSDDCNNVYKHINIKYKEYKSGEIYLA